MIIVSHIVYIGTVKSVRKHDWNVLIDLKLVNTIIWYEFFITLNDQFFFAVVNA